MADDAIREAMAPGRIKPARIVMEGEGRLGNCERCAGTGIYTDDEMICRNCNGTGDSEREPDRVAELEAQVRTLREALNMYRSAFGQALEAHGIPLGPQQRLADEISEAALAATAPKEDE